MSNNKSTNEKCDFRSEHRLVKGIDPEKWEKVCRSLGKLNSDDFNEVVEKLSKKRVFNQNLRENKWYDIQCSVSSGIDEQNWITTCDNLGGLKPKEFEEIYELILKAKN